MDDKPFTVLGFPCNEFGAQEPGTPEQILDFVEKNYAVTFPLFEKVSVKPSDDQHAVYRLLTESFDPPNWNFTKYLVGKDGTVLQRFAPDVTPDDTSLRDAIQAALNA